MTTPYERYVSAPKKLSSVDNLKLLHQSEAADVSYLAYQIKNSPMVLFSKKDNIPLVSVTLLADHSPSLITKRYEKGDLSFQGVVKNDNQEISFLLNNLTPYNLKIDLMKTNTKVTDTDPGRIPNCTSRSCV